MKPQKIPCPCMALLLILLLPPALSWAGDSSHKKNTGVPDVLGPVNIPESIQKELEKKPEKEKPYKDKWLKTPYGSVDTEWPDDEEEETDKTPAIEKEYEKCLWLYEKATRDDGRAEDVNRAVECLTDLEDDDDFSTLDKDQQESVLKMLNDLGSYIYDDSDDADEYDEDEDEGPYFPESVDSPDQEEDDNSGAKYLRLDLDDDYSDENGEGESDD